MLTQPPVPGWAEVVEELQCRDISFVEPLEAQRSVQCWCPNTRKLPN